MKAFTPQALHGIFESAFNSGDVNAILTLYEPGAVLMTGGEAVTGHQSLRDAFAGFLIGGAQMKLETRAVIESGELAVLHGAWTLGAPASTEGLSTEVVRRQADGSWMFVIDNPYTPK